MAKARVEEKEVPVTTLTTVKNVTLELTEEEAEVVKALTACVWGSSDFRNLTDNVYYALNEAGVKKIRVRTENGNLRVEAYNAKIEKVI